MQIALRKQTDSFLCSYHSYKFKIHMIIQTRNFGISGVKLIMLKIQIKSNMVNSVLTLSFLPHIISHTWILRDTFPGNKSFSKVTIKAARTICCSLLEILLYTFCSAKNLQMSILYWKLLIKLLKILKNNIYNYGWGG